MRESMRTLREHSISLALATVFGVLRQPQLVPGLISRYRSVSSNSDKEFIVTSGARSMYWGVLPEGRRIRGHHPDAKVVGGHAGPRREEISLEVEKGNETSVRGHLPVGGESCPRTCDP